ncbi:molybdenum cofactor biosynthesis enzyme MoaA [Mobilisporobacter senegalensis]|uniref:Molybdenum cofactor biosynthesis enzyme MoaA n=1 Tax=Mobilisporobacter senegalensis TaxID=1329262 RepID=A0A3N1XZE5_9FIRM|nr:radical SAM protein [Mobilisporobacter senegalensis]ROR31658.1 molybdenum cofactor biosynthesis enzyme MoaA [Mobilisporobacter senegalensis]
MKQLSREKKGTFLRASVSDLCDFACQYCATDLGMENHTPKCINAPLLSGDEYVNNMRLLATHGFETISFTGGEPLLAKDIDKIIMGCRPLFKTMEITTNGSRLLANMELIKGYIDVLKISIDAVDNDLRVKITKNSQAAKTLDVIEECCKAGIKTIGFNFVYMKQNVDELPKLVDFAKHLKEMYKTNIYISVLDLYFSAGKREFWKEEFVNLELLRNDMKEKGITVNHRLRVGCDSYNCVWNGVVVNMKDSISCTHRNAMCEKCNEYCQEGIYSLKHSASGWISTCPSNKPELGSLIAGPNVHDIIDKYIDIINDITRVDHTGEEFFLRNGLQEVLDNESNTTFTEGRSNKVS